MVGAKAVTDRYNIALGGNIPLTTRMLLGTQLDNMKYVVDLLEQLDHRNLIISPGCDMPYDTPVENAIGVLQAVRNPESARQMVAHYQAPDLAVAVTLPDYAHLPRPLLEVFTLDSDTCAACGYMLSAAQRAVAELGGRVDLVEHKFTRPETIARVRQLGIKNLPSILINGELKFSSIIPSQRELLAELEKALK